MTRAAFMFAAVLGVGTLFGAASDASACSCRRGGTVEDAAARARNIALVRVESVRIEPPRSEGQAGDELAPRGPQRARFTVVRHLKGELQQSDELGARHGVVDCGAPLIVGTELCHLQ